MGGFGALFIGTMILIIAGVCLLLFPVAPKIGDKLMGFFSKWEEDEEKTVDHESNDSDK